MLLAELKVDIPRAAIVVAKATRHPIVEERPLGRHWGRPDIRALGRTGGTDLFDVTICHPLSQEQIHDAVQNPLNILKAA